MEYSLLSARGRSSYTPRRMSHSPYRSEDSTLSPVCIEFEHRKFSSPRVVRGSHALGKQLLRPSKHRYSGSGDSSIVIINRRQIASNLLLDRYPLRAVAH